MNLSHDHCYKAIQTQDARFDGIFFTAVKTTGIYCRPVCKVPAPKSENCTFYETAAEAESKGYRPCLRCRPELAPGYSEFEQNNQLMSMVVNFMEEQHYKPGTIGECAKYFGISTRHLTRIFQETIGVSPQNYIMTQRLLMAKNLLTDTRLKVTEIALIVGFGSVSRFNAAFKKHYNLTPSQLRKKVIKKASVITVNLSYRPPYDWDMMFDFYRMRTIPGVEYVTEDQIYRRSILIEDSGITYSGWLEIIPNPALNKIILKVSHSLEKVLMTVIKKVRIAFDLDARPDKMHTDLPSGIRLPGCFDAFEMSTRAILGQQITVKAARTLTGRMVNLLGKEIKTPWPEISHHFPTTEQIMQLEKPITEVLGPIGIIKNRSNCIFGIASALKDGRVNLHPGVNPEKEKEALLSLKGIGPWTAEYLTMRGVSWPDAFPVSDIGVKHALSSKLIDEQGRLIMENKDELSSYKLNKKYEQYALAYAEDYKPWRSYLTIALWHRL